MAETDSYTTINNPLLLPQTPNKFYSHFLFKAILVSIFLLLLQLFPSESPGFINHTINNRSWELLQFVLVGIAVSYGLFSKRNDDETEKEKERINTQLYVARLLQVSSVFDDDSSESSKVQTWNSQYYRGEPIVVVAKETSNPPNEHSTSEKPHLLLPVRNLKNESFNRSNSRRFSSPKEEESQENIVLRSPIPWRSRSGRMEVKEEVAESCEIEPKSHSSFRYQSSKSSNPSEIQSKSLEDANRIHMPSFTPIPLPPPHVKKRTNFGKRNEGRRGVESGMISGNEKEEYLSDDKEIERFIERRENQKKRLVNETSYPKREDEMQKEMMETEKDDSDEELVEVVSKSNHGEIVAGNEDGPDVDKKADEFIAKFREQIRLQRIASIRRTTSSSSSTLQTPKTTTR